MIRGAVIHFASEQPLVCDLRLLPSPADVTITITNLRYVDGRKPSFIDHVESWFVYPLSGLRFIEIPAAAMGDSDLPALPAGELSETATAPDTVDDIEDPVDAAAADELLRRMREA